MFGSWFKKLKKNKKSPPRPRLAVEALEDRLTPTTLVGLLRHDLVAFDSATPGTLSDPIKISGLGDHERIISIDTRPSDGQLYGLSNKNLLYTIDPKTGDATEVGSGPAAFSLEGRKASVDFDPVNDVAEVMTRSGLNFRIDPDTGDIIDGDSGANGTQPDTKLTYASGDTNAGDHPRVAAIAFSNETAGATQTTAFGIDSKLNTLVRIGDANESPNDPTTGLVSTIGSLGIDVRGKIGFEIASNGTAYLTARTGPIGASEVDLYTVNLTTGAATKVGALGKGHAALQSLTTLPNPTTPTDTNNAANTVVEGASANTTVGITAHSTDANSGSVTYSLLNSDGGAFKIDSSNGVVSVADGTKLNFETATSATIVVQATAGSDVATQQFTIAITNANPSTPSDSNSATNTVSVSAANDATVGITASSTDVNGPAVTYSLTDDGGGAFKINSSSGVVSVKDNTKLSVGPVNITVQASDGHGGTATNTFSITVTT